LGLKKKPETNPIRTIRYVKNEWIQEQKEKIKDHGSDNVDFVSSCDLLASWFFQETQPAAGVVAMNMRERFPGLKKELVGNYIQLLFMFPDEYTSPENIRQSVSTLGEFGSKESKPGSSHGGSSCGMLTAWHSSYEELDLPNCQHLCHSPYFHGSSEIKPIMCVFRTSLHQLAVACFTDKPIRNTSPLGDAVPMF